MSIASCSQSAPTLHDESRLTSTLTRPLADRVASILVDRASLPCICLPICTKSPRPWRDGIHTRVMGVRRRIPIGNTRSLIARRPHIQIDVVRAEGHPRPLCAALRCNQTRQDGLIRIHRYTTTSVLHLQDSHQPVCGISPSRRYLRLRVEPARGRAVFAAMPRPVPAPSIEAEAIIRTAIMTRDAKMQVCGRSGESRVSLSSYS